MKKHSAFREVQVIQHGWKGENYMEGAGNEAKKQAGLGTQRMLGFHPVDGRRQ